MEWERLIYICKFLLSVVLFTAVIICTILFISHILSSQNFFGEYLYKFSTRLPQVDPKKAAVLIYGHGDDNEGCHQTPTLDWLPQKLINDLRRTLIDPRSFLVTSYGTHLGRSDYIDTPVYT
uniref:Wsv136-like protein n=1 Tax=Litopenaeus vannamei majanivirus Nimav-1_LVa TaxID=2984273 RepID=A0A9C7CCV9_9VIRU|nr:MAG: wsv136-like protein [Litopenaeus vannamei majanivirus Nimav-1_LVa]